MFIQTREQWTIPLLRAWANNGDTVETNGCGMVGSIPTLTNAAAAYAKVYDHGTTSYANLAASVGLAGWAANYQLTSDAANEEVNDACFFAADQPFCEIGFDLGGAGQLATWGGDGALWEYSQGGGSWAALTVALDNTDSGVGVNGTRPFQQSGAVSFIPPAGWATDTVDTQLGYWIRSRITALQVTQTPITNNEEHSIVSSADGFTVPAGTWLIHAVRVTDGAATLHTANDVIFIIFNDGDGSHSGAITFAQDVRNENIALTAAQSVSGGDVLWVLNTQEDGTNEPDNVIMVAEVERVSA